MIPVDDSLNQQEADYAPIKPVWVDGGNKNEKAFAEWLQGSAKTLLRVNQPRIFEMTENLLWYTGEWEWIYSGRRAIVPGKLSGEGAERRVQPMVINHLHDITERGGAPASPPPATSAESTTKSPESSPATAPKNDA